jgi:hypothetical protein
MGVGRPLFSETAEGKRHFLGLEFVNPSTNLESKNQDIWYLDANGGTYRRVTAPMPIPESSTEITSQTATTLEDLVRKLYQERYNEEPKEVVTSDTKPEIGTQGFNLLASLKAERAQVFRRRETTIKQTNQQLDDLNPQRQRII